MLLGRNPPKSVLDPRKLFSQPLDKLELCHLVVRIHLHLRVCYVLHYRLPQLIQVLDTALENVFHLAVVDVNLHLGHHRVLEICK